MNLTDDLGRKVFQTIEITLVCAIASNQTFLLT